MASIPIEQQIADKLRSLSEEQKRQVLDFVTRAAALQPPYSARELMRLPHAERQRLVTEALKSAADEDFEIFEAYSEEEMDG
jgi:hypothetical protein